MKKSSYCWFKALPGEGLYPLTFLILFVAVTLVLQSCGAKSQADESTEKPNVLIILVDDLKPAIGTYGNETAITPEMDKLASESLRFTKAYANQAVCAPSRFNLMLGSRSTSTGIYGFGRDFRDFYPDALTMPQYFKHHGYHTESMGKVYHIGHGTYDDEESWSVSPYHDKVIEYNDPESTPEGGELTREEALFSNRSWDFARSLERGAAWESPEVPDTAYADGRVAQHAIDRLREIGNDSQPFFLAVGFARPHLPFSAPQEYWDMYDSEELPMPKIEQMPDGAPQYSGKDGGEIAQYKPVPSASEHEGPYPEDLKKNLVHGYYASVSYVDTQIGKVLSELKYLDLDENTIVVLWGDHGFHLGELGIWTKHVNYELANNIPLMIKAPGVTTPGSSTGQLAETVDIYPTLAELVGLPAPNTTQPQDGVSMVPVLKDPKTRVKDHVYHTYPRGGKIGRAIRTDRYRLVEWKEIGEDPESADIELYEYNNGPVELKNIADKKPEVVERLKTILYRYPEAHLPRLLSSQM